MANNHTEIETRLWDSADRLRANSKLKSSEYSVPVLGLIFLRYADHKFAAAEKDLAGKGTGRRTITKEDYQAKGVMYLPPQARFSKLLTLPEGENIGKAINEAMKAVEAENREVGLEGVVLPKTYQKIENTTLVALLKSFSTIRVDAEGDTFGKIYEYFLGNFARAEGAKGGEFFTPTSLVKLIVEIIEPYHGRIEFFLVFVKIEFKPLEQLAAPVDHVQVRARNGSLSKPGEELLSGFCRLCDERHDLLRFFLCGPGFLGE
jgi:type I restriction enzyme M protein